MKKWILIPCGIGALVAGAATALLVSLNPIIEAGVNKFGPEVTGTHVFLKEADVSLFSGEGVLREFVLGNPKGYTAPHAARVGSVSVALDKATLTDDVIVIRKIAIDSPDIIYELGQKSNNFDDIIKNVEQLGAAREKADATKKEAASPGKDEGPARKVIIDELVITNGKAAIRMPALKLDFQADLPEIRLTDIGREKGQSGVTMAQAAKRVLKSISSQLGDASKTALKNARISLTIGSEGLGKAAKDLGNAVKSLFGK
ncbi:MAG: hypothetical protein IJD65_01090 [Mailhella sp.]|nr:hypothetical protein [Mailhella sp.]